MAVEKRTYDASIQNARKSLMMWFGPPSCHNTLTIHETTDVESLLIGRSTAKANPLR